jgi:hypothetical protein
LYRDNRFVVVLRQDCLGAKQRRHGKGDEPFDRVHFREI